MESIKEALTEVKILSNQNEHYFFGYYDLQPYDSKDEKHLCHKVSFIDRLQQKMMFANWDILILKPENL